MSETTVKKAVRKVEPKEESISLDGVKIKATVTGKAEIAEPETKTDELNKKFDDLMLVVQQLMEENAKLKSQKEAAPTEVAANRLVKIIHLCDNLPPLKTHIKTHNVLLNFGRFGETATLTFQQFEELFREYRGYFERSVIGLTAKDDDLCELYGITKTHRSPLSKSVLDNIATIDDAELKRVYELVAQTQKDVIIRSFVTGYLETDRDGNHPKDSRYNNRDRAEMLNKLSGGQLKRILDDMDYRASKK